MKKTLFIISLVCLTASSGCAASTGITSEAWEILNMNEQFNAIFDVYDAFSEDGKGFNDDFGGWNYGGDGYLHVMVTCDDTLAYEFLNEEEKRVIFEPAEYSQNYLEELAENFVLTVGDIKLEGGSVSVHKNDIIVYVDVETYNDSELMARLYEAARDAPVDFVTSRALIVDDLYFDSHGITKF